MLKILILNPLKRLKNMNPNKLYYFLRMWSWITKTNNIPINRLDEHLKVGSYQYRSQY